MNDLSLNIGRWAGGYPFFYILNRILADFKPKNILEFGLGESTKLISAYLDNNLSDATLLTIEQNSDWLDFFRKRFTLCERVEVIHCALTQKDRHGFEVNSYTNLTSKITHDFDLYVIDGPFGSPRFSRYDIVDVLEDNTPEDNFIILFDDCNRTGEQDTLKAIQGLFGKKNIPISVGYYKGLKTVAIITSKNLDYFTTM